MCLESGAHPGHFLSTGYSGYNGYFYNAFNTRVDWVRVSPMNGPTTRVSTATGSVACSRRLFQFSLYCTSQRAADAGSRCQLVWWRAANRRQTNILLRVFNMFLISCRQWDCWYINPNSYWTVTSRDFETWTTP